MIVEPLMSTHPVTVTAATPLTQAVQLLARHAITVMPVLEGDRVCGVVSEAELVRSVVGRPLSPDDAARPGPHDDRRVADVMTSDPATVHPDTDLALAVELAVATAAKSLPVLDTDGRLVGMLSLSDVIRHYARSDWQLARQIEAELAGAGFHHWVVEVRDGVATLDGPESDDVGVARTIATGVAGVVTVRLWHESAPAPR